MPELPEVETLVRALRPGLVGRRVVAVDVRWPRQAAPSRAALEAGLAGRTVQALGRRGKWLVATLDDGTQLLVHLRMSGRLQWAEPGGGEPPHVRARFTFDGGPALLFVDARKFGRLWHAASLAAATADFGPEPLDPGFSAGDLAARLAGRRRALKPLLLDQTVIAGLGNIYADESLFRAGLHPLRLAGDLSAGEVARLHRAIRAVLREAIEQQGTSLDWVWPGGHMQERLRVYGQRGRPCPRCATPIAYARVMQRGTHFCPRCQPLPAGSHAADPPSNRRPRRAEPARPAQPAAPVSNAKPPSL